MQVTDKAKAKHDTVLIKCEFAFVPFSTNERRKRVKSDRHARVIDPCDGTMTMMQGVHGSRTDCGADVQHVRDGASLPAVPD